MKIYNLKVCGCYEPISLTDEIFDFSFTMDGSNGEETTYQLLIAKTKQDLEKGNYVYQSEEFDYLKVSSVLISSDIFKSDTDYVFAIKSGNNIEYSKFSKGLLKDDFEARWITRKQISDIAPLFIKRVDLNNKTISRARLYVSGLGYFAAYINGRRVGNDGFVPQVSDYTDRPLDGLFETFPIGTRKSTFVSRNCADAPVPTASAIRSAVKVFPVPQAMMSLPRSCSL